MHKFILKQSLSIAIQHNFLTGNSVNVSVSVNQSYKWRRDASLQYHRCAIQFKCNFSCLNFIGLPHLNLKKLERLSIDGISLTGLTKAPNTTSVIKVQWHLIVVDQLDKYYRTWSNSWLCVQQFLHGNMISFKNLGSWSVLPTWVEVEITHKIHILVTVDPPCQI